LASEFLHQSRELELVKKELQKLGVVQTKQMADKQEVVS